MSLPGPEAGLVIRYSFLWAREHDQGAEEGRKSRPCVVLLVVEADDSDFKRVVTVPVTHRVPDRREEAIEIPPPVKRRLRLDDDQSWIVLSETNDFIWPGPDLARIGDPISGAFVYGQLPGRFFDEVVRRFVALERARRVRRIPRT